MTHHLWISPSRKSWVAKYDETYARREFYQAYRALHDVPAHRVPWSIDNRRIGDDIGFKTLQEAVTAAQAWEQQ